MIRSKIKANLPWSDEFERTGEAEGSPDAEVIPEPITMPRLAAFSSRPAGTLPARPADISELGGMVAVRCPGELDEQTGYSCAKSFSTTLAIVCAAHTSRRSTSGERSS
jgi:hypothetical protein